MEGGALAPSLEGVRAANALLDLGVRLDPARAAPDPALLVLEEQLCRRDDCPPPARFVVAARLRAGHVPFDAARDLRLNDPSADFAASESRLAARVRAAGDDVATALNAYRTFSHELQGPAPLLAVACAAEEDALERYPAGTPGRYHVLLAHAITLQALGRGEEGAPFMADAVRECEERLAGAGPADAPAAEVALADTLFWSAGFTGGQGRREEALGENARATAHARHAGRPCENGYWPLQRAELLHGLGRDEEALAALKEAAGWDYPDASARAPLEAQVRAALDAARAR
jgi:hypothetical protein